MSYRNNITHKFLQKPVDTANKVMIINKYLCQMIAIPDKK